MAYLNETHPEVFFAIPRPGGIAKIELPPTLEISRNKVPSSRSLSESRSRSRSLRSKTSTRSKGGFAGDNLFQSTGGTSREYRVNTAMVSSPWVLFDNTFDFPKPPNPAQDVIDILTITISTIMLLAAGHGDIPIEHQKWALSYLENITDEFGNTPPNITGIMNHLKMINPELVSFNYKDSSNLKEEDKDENEEAAATPETEEREIEPTT